MHILLLSHWKLKLSTRKAVYDTLCLVSFRKVGIQLLARNVAKSRDGSFFIYSKVVRRRSIPKTSFERRYGRGIPRDKVDAIGVR